METKNNFKSYKNTGLVVFGANSTDSKGNDISGEVRLFGRPIFPDNMGLYPTKGSERVHRDELIDLFANDTASQKAIGGWADKIRSLKYGENYSKYLEPLKKVAGA